MMIEYFLLLTPDLCPCFFKGIFLALNDFDIIYKIKLICFQTKCGGINDQFIIL